MTEDKLIEFARHLKEEGKTDEQITAALINSGLAEDDTPRIIGEAKKKPAIVAEEKSPLPPPATKPKAKKGWWPF